MYYWRFQTKTTLNLKLLDFQKTLNLKLLGFFGGFPMFFFGGGVDLKQNRGQRSGGRFVFLRLGFRCRRVGWRCHMVSSHGHLVSTVFTSAGCRLQIYLSPKNMFQKTSKKTHRYRTKPGSTPWKINGWFTYIHHP